MVLSFKIRTALTIVVVTNFSIPIGTTHFKKLEVLLRLVVFIQNSVAQSSLFQNIIFVAMPIAYGMSIDVIELLVLVFLGQK